MQHVSMIVEEVEYFFFLMSGLHFNLFNCRISHSWRTRVVEYLNKLHTNLNSSPLWLVEIYLIEINGPGNIENICWSAASDVLKTSAFISCRSLIETDRPVCAVNLNANRPSRNLALKLSLEIVRIFKRASLFLEILLRLSNRDRLIGLIVGYRSLCVQIRVVWAAQWLDSQLCAFLLKLWNAAPTLHSTLDVSQCSFGFILNFMGHIW
jgi:hypothetical protein